MNRNKLTEIMLGLEIDIRFISIKEAVKAGIMGEPAKIEAALHHPILLAIAGERDLTVLADAMRQALTDAGFGNGVDDVVELFCDKNRREGMMAVTRRNPSCCMVFTARTATSTFPRLPCCLTAVVGAAIALLK